MDSFDLITGAIKRPQREVVVDQVATEQAQ
jgi:hypothetical protein